MPPVVCDWRRCALTGSFQHRSHTCGQLRSKDAGKSVHLCGWLQFKRMGRFFTLRDGYGVTQLILSDEVPEPHVGAWRPHTASWRWCVVLYLPVRSAGRVTCRRATIQNSVSFCVATHLYCGMHGEVSVALSAYLPLESVLTVLCVPLRTAVSRSWWSWSRF